MDDELGSRVAKCLDGKYRWVFEMSLTKNPTIPLLLLKVALLIVGIVFVLFLVMGIIDGTDIIEVLGFGLEVCGIALAIILVLGLVAYLIYGSMMQWKYCVIFEMDDEGVLHAQQEAQVKKAGVMSDIAILAGLVAGNPTTVGAGLLSKTNSSMYTAFEDVRIIRAAKNRNVIYVNNNHVYVCDEDFDFVLDFIKTRSPKAKN
jgi:hypothetical protein